MNAIAHASARPLRGPKLDNRRVLAGVVDLAIVAVGAAVILFAADALAANEMKGALGAVILGWALYYFFALESGDGQTVGKKLMKLRVVREDGSPAGMREIAVRTILRVIDNYLVGLIVMLATGERRQRIGDMAAGTVVVDASGPAPVAAAAAPVAEPVAAEEPVEEQPVEDEPVQDDHVQDEPVQDEPAAAAPAPTSTITLPARPAPPATLSDLGGSAGTEQAEAPEEAAAAEETVGAEAAVGAEETASDALPEITSPSIEELARDVQAAREPVETEAIEAAAVEPEPVDPEPVVEVESYEPEPEPAGAETVVAVEPVVSVEPDAGDEPAAGDEEVNVRSVETVSAIDLIMGGAPEPEGSDEAGEPGEAAADDRPASA